jgi:hypothetical protein
MTITRRARVERHLAAVGKRRRRRKGGIAREPGSQARRCVVGGRRGARTREYGARDRGGRARQVQVGAIGPEASRAACLVVSHGSVPVPRGNIVSEGGISRVVHRRVGVAGVSRTLRVRSARGRTTPVAGTPASRRQSGRDDAGRDPNGRALPAESVTKRHQGKHGAIVLRERPSRNRRSGSPAYAPGTHSAPRSWGSAHRRRVERVPRRW